MDWLSGTGIAIQRADGKTCGVCAGGVALELVDAAGVEVGRYSGPF